MQVQPLCAPFENMHYYGRILGMDGASMECKGISPSLNATEKFNSVQKHLNASQTIEHTPLSSIAFGVLHSYQVHMPLCISPHLCAF